MDRELGLGGWIHEKKERERVCVCVCERKRERERERENRVPVEINYSSEWQRNGKVAVPGKEKKGWKGGNVTFRPSTEYLGTLPSFSHVVSHYHHSQPARLLSFALPHPQLL